MSVAYPLHIIRKTDRKWLCRPAQPLLPALPHEPATTQNCCSGCGNRAPVAPWRSDYVPGGTIEHHWACSGCGQTWITRIDVTRLRAAHVDTGPIDPPFNKMASR